MINLKFFGAMVMLLWLGCAFAKAQKVEALSFALTNESIAFPLTRFSPIHPGFEMGAVLKRWEKPTLLKEFSLGAGFYHHERVENAFYFKAEYAFRPKVRVVSFDFIGSAGYMHTFYPGEMYELTASGEPDKIRQLGRPHAFLSISIGLSYVKPTRLNPFLRQEVLVKAPFASSIPAIIHSLLKLGVTINLNNNE